MQRTPYFVLVDEADSILIDEARTPLIISAPAERGADRSRSKPTSGRAVGRQEFVEDEHYEYDHEKKTVELTAEGRRLVRMLPKPDTMHSIGMFTIYEYIERAIKVEREFFRDRQYVVRDGEIVIVDEFTGRMAEGASGAPASTRPSRPSREGVEVTVETGQAARITVQDFFLLYPHLAGMTGTASNSAGELQKIYKLRVVPIPTNRPAIRQRLPDRVFGLGRRQMAGDRGRSVPRCTPPGGRCWSARARSTSPSCCRSCSRPKGFSMTCSTPTTLPPRPRSWPGPATIGQVTVSTNMAGRGTDIKLGEGVNELGGLHVISPKCTTRPASTANWPAAAVARAIPARSGFTWRSMMTCCWVSGPTRPSTTKSSARSRRAAWIISAVCSAKVSERSNVVTSATAK